MSNEIRNVLSNVITTVVTRQTVASTVLCMHNTFICWVSTVLCILNICWMWQWETKPMGCVAFRLMPQWYVNVSANNTNLCQWLFTLYIKGKHVLRIMLDKTKFNCIAPLCSYWYQFVLFTTLNKPSPWYYFWWWWLWWCWWLMKWSFIEYKFVGLVTMVHLLLHHRKWVS